MGGAVLLPSLPAPKKEVKPFVELSPFVNFARRAKIKNSSFYVGHYFYDPTSAQLRVVDAFDNYDYVIINKSRQVGMTTTAALWALQKCMTQENQTIVIAVIGHGLAMRIWDIITSAEGNVLAEGNLSWSNSIRGYLGVKEFPRTRSHLILDWEHRNRYQAPVYKNTEFTYILDEAAFIKDMGNYWHDIMRKDAKVVAYSTPNGSPNGRDWFATAYHYPHFNWERNWFATRGSNPLGDTHKALLAKHWLGTGHQFHKEVITREEIPYGGVPPPTFGTIHNF